MPVALKESQALLYFREEMKLTNTPENSGKTPGLVFGADGRAIPVAAEFAPDADKYNAALDKLQQEATPTMAQPNATNETPATVAESTGASEDNAGNEIQYSADMFETAPDALLMLPDGVDIWESSATDLNPIRNVVLDNIKILAAESKTPLYILSPESSTSSAEGASMQNEPLIFDIESLEMRITSTLRRLFADAMLARGDSERADATKINIDWVNPKRPSDVERMSAVQLATSAGVPLTVALRKFGGFSALDIAEVERVQGNQALRDLVVANATAQQNLNQKAEQQQSPGTEDTEQGNPEPDPRNRQVLNNTSPEANLSNQRNGGAI